MPTLRFYFDYLSTNAYLAWLQMPTLARRYGVVVEPVPVLFAGLLEAHGTSGPGEVPAKALWMFKNNLRKAALPGVPLNAPAFHPFNPLRPVPTPKRSSASRPMTPSRAASSVCRRWR